MKKEYTQAEIYAQTWQAFDALWRRADLLGCPSASFTALARQYRAPGRHYHTLDHILDCVGLLWSEFAWKLANNLPAVGIALMYHDVCYDPLARKGLNQERSADFAQSALMPVVKQGSLALDVAWLIAAYPNHIAKGDAALVHDIDLAAGFGVSFERFQADTILIYQESALPRAEFLERREVMLRRMLEELDRGVFYRTSEFRETYAAVSWENIESQLRTLSECIPA